MSVMLKKDLEGGDEESAVGETSHLIHDHSATSQTVEGTHQMFTVHELCTDSCLSHRTDHAKAPLDAVL